MTREKGKRFEKKKTSTVNDKDIKKLIKKHPISDKKNVDRSIIITNLAKLINL
jgi:hypothetical protein